MNKSKIAHRTVNILGFQLFSKDRDSLLKKLKIHLSRKNDPLVIFTPNAEQFAQASSNPNFSRQLKQADLLLPDGIGLIFASKLLSLVSKSKPLNHRITGVDLTHDLLKLAQEHSFKVLLLGGRGYQSLVNSSREVNEFSCWQLEGNLYWTPGYRSYSDGGSNQEEEHVSSCIAALKPDVVLVALGAPIQEEWIIDHLDLLSDSEVKIAMAVGGAADMILGKLNRAPLLVRKIGLEWLYRLLQEPWRWKRQLRLIKFIRLVLKQALTGYEIN